MQSFLLLAALLASPAVADLSHATMADLSHDLEGKNRPVTKVINLLKDMIKQMEKEGEEDEEVFEKMGCWCVTNEKAKTKSVADAEEAISDLTSAIEAFTASSAKLNTEVAMLEKELAKNTEALDSATAMREKDLAAFNAEEKETLMTISSLKAAVIALSKHHDAAFLQLQQGSAQGTKKQSSAVHDYVVHIEGPPSQAAVPP